MTMTPVLNLLGPRSALLGYIFIQGSVLWRRRVGVVCGGVEGEVRDPGLGFVKGEGAGGRGGQASQTHYMHVTLGVGGAGWWTRRCSCDSAPLHRKTQRPFVCKLCPLN